METIVTVEMIVKLTKEQANNIPNVGDIDLFGDAAIEADVIKALQGLVRETEKRIKLIGQPVAW